MLTAQEIRSTPNKGRYLFNNPLLRGVIRSLDWLIELFSKPSRVPFTATPKRILLCCQAHIGDAILATSILPVVKSAFPDAQIGFLIHPGSIEILADNPGVKWVHTYNHWKLNRQNLPFWKKLLSYLKSRTQALKEIKANGYELAIDLYPYFPNSIPLLFSANVPLRLGWTSAGFGGLLTHGIDWQDNLGHVVDWHKHLLAMLSPCQTFLPLARPEIYTSDETREQWKKVAEKFDIPDNFVAFHIGAGGAHKYWPTENWQQLASHCVKIGRSIVLLGYGKEEQAICATIARNKCNKVYDFVRKPDLAIDDGSHWALRTTGWFGFVLWPCCSRKERTFSLHLHRYYANTHVAAISSFVQGHCTFCTVFAML